MTITDDGPRRLPKGSNVALDDLDAGLGSVTVVLETYGHGDHAVDADVSVLLLGVDGRVRSSEDLVFYNQPVALGGAVHLRHKARSEGDEGDPLAVDVVTLELDDIPDEVARIVLSATLDPSTGKTFGDARSTGMRVQRTADAQDLLAFEIGDATSETALLVGEFYRRAGGWRVRAIGQGYSGGLAALVADHGVDIAGDEPTSDENEERASDGEDEHGDPDTRTVQSVDDTFALATGATLPAAGAATTVSRAVSVRRPVRAPKLPSDWDSTIPAAEGNDWQPARLFSVSGIGRGEEQERRATSALLAVMRTVREFGRVLTARCGAPAGMLTTFVEVPFGQDENAYQPDGVLRVVRGQKQWTALVEVKTHDGRLKQDQIDHYVDIARSRGFDAVITISNELTGPDTDHPLPIDRRKLRKLALVHLSWDQIRTEAVLLARHRGVADSTQRHVLEEFLRYMNHPGSGMAGLTDMGQHWVRVRESVKNGTARSGEKPIVEISARFDQLVQHVGLQLSSILGVNVTSAAARNAPDNASRCQQLADSGLLFGCLRIPGAVDLLVIRADLRADRVGASITIPAPRGDTRPATRVSWLLRQIPDAARDTIRVEALLAGGRGNSTAGLLGKIRADSGVLLAADQREIRAFTLSLELPMGTKRAAGTGTLIHSVKGVTTAFYADVVQHLRPWTPPSRT